MPKLSTLFPSVPTLFAFSTLMDACKVWPIYSLSLARQYREGCGGEGWVEMPRQNSTGNGTRELPRELSVLNRDSGLSSLTNATLLSGFLRSQDSEPSHCVSLSVSISPVRPLSRRPPNPLAAGGAARTRKEAPTRM
ncbi:hypothetical protein B0H63DRAFT_32520 [Podospora didyma]|uniref:Uncharacterized protein n=1 Tax=Podospora didyma TaxID=330526 RepID=A0AAE0P5X0_9PEZI|nr:hypothetical protein B0H63DRAFT_32520 [Podospora didyma]